MQKGSRLTVYILLSMVIGVIIGYLIHINASPAYIAKISPQLKVDDIKGDWPIARTSGPLDGARIKMPFGQCANAYQQYTVVVVPGVFEGIQCLRILTPR